LAVIVHRPWRHHLLSVHPYLGLLLGAALFSPVILWNAQHDWASFRFPFAGRWDPEPMELRHVLAFAGLQLATATPIVLWACCQATAAEQTVRLHDAVVAAIPEGQMPIEREVPAHGHPDGQRP